MVDFGLLKRTYPIELVKAFFFEDIPNCFEPGWHPVGTPAI